MSANKHVSSVGSGYLHAPIQPSLLSLPPSHAIRELQTHGLPLRLAWNSFLQRTRPSTRLASASRLASSADSTPAAAAQGMDGWLVGWEGACALGAAGGCDCLVLAAPAKPNII